MDNKNSQCQGKKARCLFNYKATMTDELNIKTDDIIVLIQCSDDETWFEGTLNGLTGWFPSNYVQILEEPSEIRISQSCESFSSEDEKSRNKYVHELKLIEENFLDEICKFVKITILPLKSNEEIFNAAFVNSLSSCLDEVIRCHQAFYQQLKELPEDGNTKIGHFMINFAPQFKNVYENYARNNPKFTHLINNKKEKLSKFFEPSISKMTSPLLTTTSTITVAIYFTKFLATPFKQLEIYVKFLKEIQRFTKDSHVDRGDVQRSIEFYSELTNSILEIRKMREYELDIMSSKINNLDENLFKKGESSYLSQAVLITENGEIKDRILILISNHMVILCPTNDPNEFDFETRIFFLNQDNKKAAQIKKITNIDSLKNVYGPNFDSSNFVNKYCFELSDVTLQNKVNSGHVGKVLVMCSTFHDLKMWIELITEVINRTQANLNFSSLKKNLSINKQKNDNSKSFTSPSIIRTKSKKMFCIRPHAPLIPHFQLPNDIPILNNQDPNSTLKRFMYKKPKSSDIGKYHGADDDLKLLNVIDSLSKIKIRQGSNISSKNSTSNINEKSNQINKSNNSIRMRENFNESFNSTSTMNEKSLTKYVNQLVEEKKQLEAQLHSVNNELNEFRKANRELKTILISYQKQLEIEKQARKKLENSIKKNTKQNQKMISDEQVSLTMSLDHESAI